MRSVFYQTHNLTPRIPPSNRQEWTSFDVAFCQYSTIVEDTQTTFKLIPNTQPPNGWLGLQLEAKIKSPFSAAQQRWADFPPAIPPPVSSQQEWTTFDVAFSQYSTTIEDTQQTFQSFAVAVNEGWRGLQLDAQIKAVFNAAQQRWTDFEPAGFIAVFFPEGWRGLQLDAKTVAPLVAAQQRFDDVFEPSAAVASYPDGWRGLQLEARTQKPFGAALQRWLDFEPAGFIPQFYPEGWREDLSATFARPFIARGEIASPVSPPPATVFPEGWRGLQLDLRSVQPFNTTQQRWTDFEPAGFIAVFYPEGWRGLQLDSKVVPPFAASQQRWADFFEPTAAVITFPEGWRGLQLDSKIVPPLSASLQRWTDFEPAGFIPQFYPEGWREDLSAVTASKFLATLQQWSAFGQPSAVTVLPEGWRGLQLDAQSVRPLNSTLQRWTDFEPAGFIPQFYPEGWREDLSAAIVRTFVVRGDTVNPLFRAAAFPEGWREDLSVRSATPFSAALQRFAELQQSFVVVAQNGWFEDLASTVSVKAPFSPTQQRWATTDPITTSAGFSAPYGWETWKFDFARGQVMPVNLQAWSAFPPAGTIVTTIQRFEWIIRARRRGKR